MVSQKEIIEALRVAWQFELAKRIEAEGIAPPEGWVLLPSEPTAKMVEAYTRASEQLIKNHLLSGSYPATWQPIEAGYKAMLAAAPKGVSHE